MLRGMTSPPRIVPRRRPRGARGPGARTLAPACGALVLAGCAGAEAPAPAQDPPAAAVAAPTGAPPPDPTPAAPVVETHPGATDPAAEPAELGGDYAFGLDRDAIADTVAETFASSGGSAQWEGDALVLSIEGHADDSLTVHRTCRVLAELVAEGDQVVIAFPDGRVGCAEVLEG